MWDGAIRGGAPTPAPLGGEAREVGDVWGTTIPLELRMTILFFYFTPFSVKLENDDPSNLNL